MRKVAGVGAGLVLVAGLAGLNAQTDQEGAKDGSGSLAAQTPRLPRDLIVTGAQEAGESPSPTTEPPVTTTTEPEAEEEPVTTPPTVPPVIPPVPNPTPTFPKPSTTLPSSSSELASIRACESGGNYSTNTGNGYYGAYQFDLSTWAAAGGSGYPHLASPAEQDMRAQMWINAGYRGAWPNC